MEFIKVEPNTDGEIQPTFFLSEVKEEDNCLTVMRAEGVVSCVSNFVAHSLSVPKPYSVFITLIIVL
jgi:hypothetical protein